MGEVTWFRVHGERQNQLDHRNYTDRIEQPWVLENMVRQGGFCEETR